MQKDRDLSALDRNRAALNNTVTQEQLRLQRARARSAKEFTVETFFDLRRRPTFLNRSPERALEEPPPPVPAPLPLSNSLPRCHAAGSAFVRCRGRL